MTAPPHPAAAAAAALPPWHLARSLQSLLDAVNGHWPGRDKRSDGGIGDAAHQSQGAASDHNAWLSSSLGPAVRAYDFTAAQPGINGVDGAWLAEQLRLLGAAGDNRLAGHTGSLDDNGYLIFNHKITTPDFSRWVGYDGSDPHTSHVHVSVTRNPAGFEDPRAWDFLGPGAHANPVPASAPAAATLPPEPAAQHPAPAGQPAVVAGPHDGNAAPEAPAPVGDFDGPEPGEEYPPRGADATGTGNSFRAQWGNQGPNVQRLQKALNQDLPAYAQIPETGLYGDETTAVVEDFARRVASDPHCPPDFRDALAASNGDNVGPHLAAVFPLYGVHV